MSEERQFQVGDRVLYNGSLVADITHIDYEVDRLVLRAAAGGGQNDIYGHISNSRLELINTPGTGDEAHTGPKAVEDDETEAVEGGAAE